MAAPSPAPEVARGGDAGDPRIADRRARGAQRVDPVRFARAEALARQAAAHDGAARLALDEALSRELAALDAHHARALNDAGAIANRLAAQHPQAAADVQRLLDDGDVRALRRLAAQVDTQSALQSLRDLVQALDHHAALPDAAAPGGAPRATAPSTPTTSAPTELKAVRQARGTWSRLRIDQQLAASLAKIPDNPGPLNSHLLVLRALRRLQDVSPAYLHRFVSQLEALMWLEQAALAGASPPPGKTARREGAQKQKVARKPA